MAKKKTINYSKKIDKLNEETEAKEYVRSYEIGNLANQGKKDHIYDFITHEYRSACTIVKQVYIKLLKSGELINIVPLDKNYIDFPQDCPIEGRQLKNVINQVVQDLKSWQEQAIIEGRKIIHEYVAEHDLSDEQAR